MGYQDTRHAVVVAAGNTGLDKWNALRNHFNGGGSFRWLLANPADPSLNGLWLQKAGEDRSIIIRRDTAGSTWFISSAVDGLFGGPGNTTSPVGMLGGADPDYVLERQHIPDTNYNKMLVIEFDDAIAILEYGNSSENTFPKGIHAGITAVPVDPSYAAEARFRGNMVHVGPPSTNGIGAGVSAWFSSGGSTTTNAQMARAFSTAYWPTADTVDAVNVVGDAPGPLTTTAPIPIALAPHVGTAYLRGFVSKWLRFVSADATGGGNPGTRYEVGDDAWCRIGTTATTSARLCINVQKSKAVR